jgi:hypothetical protein
MLERLRRSVTETIETGVIAGSFNKLLKLEVSWKKDMGQPVGNLMVPGRL